MRRSILLIEHDEEMRGAARDVLARAGWDVTVADTGRSALTLLPSLPDPVVLVLGPRLPDMSTAEFLAHLREDVRRSD